MSCMTMKKHFHINGYALSLVLNKMADENRKIEIESSCIPVLQIT